MKHRDGLHRIGDLAARFGLTVRAVRYYEELGLLESSDRSEGLHRRYSSQNIIWLKRIAQLKSYGLSLGEIREFFDLAKRDVSGESCRRLLLRTYKERINTEEQTIRDAENRKKELRVQMLKIEKTKKFFSCPGKACPSCASIDLCSTKYDDMPAKRLKVVAR